MTAAAKRAKRLAIWRGMTPEQRDYDRFVARQIPHGATWGAETKGGLEMEAERDIRMDDDSGPDGCSCHINPPCSWCLAQPED